MKTLSQHNDYMRENAAKHAEQKARPTRIACDLCGSELMEPYPFNVFASHPPQMRVECHNCKFVGFAAK